jgi:hypothetical protein
MEFFFDEDNSESHKVQCHPGIDLYLIAYYQGFETIDPGIDISIHTFLQEPSLTHSL